MNEEQRYLLNELKRFDSFCKKHQIQYYLGGGCALGAIRHGGFIPWDDDVDLYITRFELEKLKQHKSELRAIGFFYLDNRIYPEYGNTVVRIVEDISTMFNPTRMNDGTPKGFMIELFILDPMPDKKEEQVEWKKKQIAYFSLADLNFSALRFNQLKSIDLECLKEYQKRSQEVGREQVLQELEEELFTIEETETSTFCMRWCGNDIRFDASWLGEPRMVPFEDALLPILPGAEYAFREEYGNKWMYFPENVESDHDFVLNYSVSYKKYMEDYMTFVDSQMLRTAYRKKKKLMEEYFFAVWDTMHKSQEFHRIQVQLNLNRNISSEEMLREIYEKRNLCEIKKIFSQWEKIQFSNIFKYEEKYLDIGDDYLYYALLGLIDDGRIWDALKILSWNEENTGKNAELKQKLDAISDAWFFWHSGDNSATEVALRKSLNIMEEIEIYEEEFLKFHMRNDYITEERPDLLDGLLSEVENFFEKYPDRKELLELIADINRKKGNIEQAIDLYQRCENESQNGVLNLRAKKALMLLRNGRKND